MLCDSGGGLVVANSIQNGNFVNGTTGWSPISSTLSVTNNTLSITGTGADKWPRCTQLTTIPYQNGKKIYCRMTYRATNPVCSYATIILAASGMTNINALITWTLIENIWYTTSSIATLGAGGSGNITLVLQHSYADATTAVGKIMEVQNVIAIDLTACFGTGNEPPKEYIDSIVQQYNYWNGQLIV